MELENKIGITGKSGVGKSTISRYIGKATGIEVLNFDDVMFDIFGMPIMQFICEKIIGGKLPERSVIMHTAGDFGAKIANSKLGRVSIGAFKSILNGRLKKIINDNNRPMIVEFAMLPELDIANQFGTKIHVIGDDKLRHICLARREAVSIGQAERFSRFLDSITDYTAMDYNNTVINDYNGMSDEIKRITESIGARYSER